MSEDARDDLEVLSEKSKGELSEEILIIEKKISRFRDEKRSTDLIKELYDMLEKRRNALKEKLNEGEEES